jgi:hypothetical protein
MKASLTFFKKSPGYSRPVGFTLIELLVAHDFRSSIPL